MMAFSLPDLMDVVHKHNRNPTPKPMPVEEVDRLRVRKYRDPQNSETVALPESLKALLAYDCQLTSPHGQRVLESVLDAIDEHGVLLSDSLDEDAYYMNGLDMIGLDIEELMPVWNDDPRLPALIRLCHPGISRYLSMSPSVMNRVNILSSASRVKRMTFGWQNRH